MGRTGRWLRAGLCGTAATGCPAAPAALYSQLLLCTPLWLSLGNMRNKIRFLWNATRGHRLAPWRSPYLLWRIETYTGVKMKQIGFVEFWEFMWRERHELWRFLRWTGEMERHAHPKPKSS